MTVSALSLLGLPGTPQTIPAKPPADYPAHGLLVEEFDLFVQGYAGATVIVLKAGTTELMPCYSDPQLTVAIPNPQVLITKTDSLNNTYGKFLQSVYVPFAYELEISSSEQSGQRQVPITDLAGEDASLANVTATGSTTARSLASRAADDIRFLDFGEVSASATTNTATLAAAIAAASALGGGEVILPADTIAFLNISLPESVILKGQGKDVTILQSQLADEVITITGDSAGLKDLQLDGVQLLAGSIGIYGKAVDFITMERVLVRRFDRNIVFQGGQNHVYRELFSKNGNKCVEFLGDTNATGDGLGSEFSGLDWLQGEVSESTESGLLMQVVDQAVRHNTISQVDFLDNVGTDGALRIIGASWAYFNQVYFDGNEKNLKISDNPDTTLEWGQVSDLYFKGGQMQAGLCTFDGLCQSIVFDALELNEVEFDLNVPENPIIFRDCTEYLTLFTTDATKVNRWRTINHGASQGTTTGATPATVWKTKMRPNEVVQLLVQVTAERQNGSGYADFLYCVGARCAGATLNYDSQTANFTVGSTIQGATSGATAIITADADSGTTGILTLAAVNGEFVDNEIIAEVSGSGSATANGTMIQGTAALIDAATELRASGSNAGVPPAGWEVTFAASVQELLVKVTGAASNDIVWNVNINAVIL